MQKKSQRGFTTVLAFIILVAIVGSVGYYVISQNNKTTQINEQAAQESDASSVLAKSKTTDFVVKEWGVSMALTKSASDAVYAISTTNKDVAYISSASAVKISNDCSPLKTSLMALSRLAKGSYKSAEPASMENQKPFATVGNYEYVLSSAQAACYDTNNKKDGDTITAFKTAFTADTKSLKLVK